MRHSGVQTVRGVACSVLASALFGLIFYLSGVIDASPEAVFGWRMVITAACYVLALTTAGARRLLIELWHDVRARWTVALVLVITSALVGFEMWLFAWAPVHGHGLDASLGYLLLPIALVLIGRVVFTERVTGLQSAAVSVAVVAVAVKVVATLAVSWVTLGVCVGYALYFAVRRWFGTGTPVAFGVEVVLTLPVAVTLIAVSGGSSTAGAFAAVLVAGLAGAIAMSAYVGAAAMLSMPVFGLLSYLEPVLMFVVALVLGERLSGVDVSVYLLLACALGVLAYAGFVSSRAPAGEREVSVQQTGATSDA